jgi:signal transduction histidine kinase
MSMSIVKEIMELHGDTVSLQSVPSSGTTVTLWFQSTAAD